MSYNRAIFIVLSLAVIGLADAVYLSVKHYLGGAVPCSLTEGCDTVLTSPYAVFGGLPVALWGAFYYLTVIFLAAMNLPSLGGVNHRQGGASSQDSSFGRAVLFGLSSAALMTSAILVYLQGQVLAAWCTYCLLSAALALLIFLTLLFSRRAG